MVEIADYERRGDLAAHFELTKKAEKAQKQSEQIRDAVRCETPSLTWEQYVAPRVYRRLALTRSLLRAGAWCES
ncbi:hypothetical protein N8K70_17085 [Microbacterium betulae]|uniref:Uncharacterized protein n=1 Tax=Microbacterium betulae TaxID=2981139 RepID=A0AA97FM67_9MICO|nr:hypothetical protein [Microbacterium sp. AB]WOF24785.1 hypothetical protein N8K70_17085 [Microbacterium sp. AB]